MYLLRALSGYASLKQLSIQGVLRELQPLACNTMTILQLPWLDPLHERFHVERLLLAVVASQSLWVTATPEHQEAALCCAMGHSGCYNFTDGRHMLLLRKECAGPA